MSGTRRVVLFCVLVVFMPAVLLIIPLYVKNTVYSEVVYAVTESDVLEINDGISNVFCSEHSLKMNDSFNAYQVSRRPETTSYRKHLRLKKSTRLPDDTLEYWGFYLLKGATVALSVCSRFEGASILVVKGERNLRTCGMLDHNKNKALTSGIYLPEANQVKIIFESHAQEINSKEAAGTKRKESPRNDTAVEGESTHAEEKQTTTPNIGKTEDDVNAYNVLNATTARTTNKTESKSGTSNTNKTESKSATRNTRRVEKSGKVGGKDNKLEATDEDVEFVGNSVLEEKLKKLQDELREVNEDEAREDDGEVAPKVDVLQRTKRNHSPQSPSVMLDQGIKHGGTNAAKNVTDDDSSISSFENGLLTCYNGNVLVSQEFDPSEKCLDVNYLITGKHMQTIHNVTEDGYYYYLFYSDNDIVSNDIHAVFDIYKPTLQYENGTKKCINQTHCTFGLHLFSSERVIVEVPTRNGIDHENDDIYLLTSECHPRMEIYAIFPIAILIFVLGCAFI